MRNTVRLLFTLATSFACALACDDGAANDSAGDSSEGGSSSMDGTGATGGSAAESGPVTWHQDVAPLAAEKCGGCHREGGIGPFSLETYEEAEMWATHLAAAVTAGTMPPWGAQETEECTPPGRFKDDLRLTEREKDLFVRWASDGAPEGDAAKAAPLPAPPSLDLDTPNRQLTIPSPVTVEGTSDEFVCFTLDPEVTEDVWLTGSQISAGNDAIVHHALVFLDREGQGEQLADEDGRYDCFGSPLLDRTALLGVWAPGAVPGILPANTGIPLRPGDKLVVQVHYHPTGQGPETDESTRIDLEWTKDEPDFVGGIFLIGNFDEVDPDWAGGKGYGLTTGPEFLIPAGATDHRETNRYWLDDGGDPLSKFIPVHVWMIGTHMHYVGTDMKITATSPEGEEQCLIQTPNWDFNWQRGYFFEGEVADLPVIHAGDSLTMRCTYDNSVNNPFVREALDDQGLSEPHDVALGDETLDEMCLGVFGLAVQKEYAADFGFE